METADKIAQPVLVTGATGFIGRRVVHKLLQKEIDVKVLVLPNEVIPSGMGRQSQNGVRQYIGSPFCRGSRRRSGNDHSPGGDCYRLGRRNTGRLRFKAAA